MVQQAYGLQETEAQELFKLLLTYGDVFADDLGRTNLVTQGPRHQSESCLVGFLLTDKNKLRP